MNFGIKDKKRILIAFFAVIGMGISVSFLLRVNMGTDPYTCMNTGAAAKLGLTFGSWQALLNFFLLGIVFVCDRKQIGWGTIFNMLLVGYMADFFTWLSDLVLTENLFYHVSVRWFVMIPALVLFVLAASLYMSAGLGAAPYDALIFIVADHIPGVPLRIVRIFLDGIGCVIGYLLGSTVGVVTILIALALGPVVQWMKEKMDCLLI